MKRTKLFLAVMLFSSIAMLQAQVKPGLEVKIGGVRLFGGEIFTGLAHRLESLLQGFDFTEILMGAMLNFLLFAGALHININDLKNYKIHFRYHS